MAITISTPPDAVYFAQNVVDLQFIALEKFTQNGSIAKVTFDIGQPLVDGDGFNFATSLNGDPYDVDIIFRAAPDPLLYELVIYDGVSEYAVFLQGVIDLLTSHHDLSEAFSFGFSVNSDKIVAQGLFMDLNTPVITGIVITTSQVNDNLGVIPVSLLNYRMRLWLIIGNEMLSDYVDSYRTPEIEYDPDYQGKVQARLNQYFDSVISQAEPLPAINNDYNLAKYVNRPVSVVVASKYGIPLVNQKGNVIAKFRVLQGGMTHTDLSKLTESASLASVLGARFLTNRFTRYVASDQPGYLFYYADQDLPNADFIIKATFFKSPAETLTIFSGPLAAGLTYGINVQIDIIANDSIWTANDTITKLEMSILDTGVGTGTNTVCIIPEIDYQTIWFEYRNTFGIPETIKFSGDFQFYHSITKQLFEKDLPWEASLEDPTFLSALETNSLFIDVSTGALRREDAMAFSEFIASRHVFMLQNGERLPIRIVSTEAISNREDHNLSTAYPTSFTAIISKSKGTSRILF
jgi:hypothetical protein